MAKIELVDIFKKRKEMKFCVAKYLDLFKRTGHRPKKKVRNKGKKAFMF